MDEHTAEELAQLRYQVTQLRKARDRAGDFIKVMATKLSKLARENAKLREEIKAGTAGN